MAPIYKDLTPGSDNLMAMLGKPFPAGIKAYVVAGDAPLLASVPLHDEAPDHDDGVVSISSTSLLPIGVPLLFMHKNHEQQPTHADTAELIGQFVSDTIVVGNDKPIVFAPGVFPKTSLPSYADMYPTGFWTNDPNLKRGGIIVDFRKSSHQVDQIKLTRLATNEVRTEFQKSPVNKNVLYFNYQKEVFGLGGTGLGYPFHNALYDDVRIEWFDENGKKLGNKDVTLYPCSTTPVIVTGTSGGMLPWLPILLE